MMHTMSYFLVALVLAMPVQLVAKDAEPTKTQEEAIANSKKNDIPLLKQANEIEVVPFRAKDGDWKISTKDEKFLRAFRESFSFSNTPAPGAEPDAVIRWKKDEVTIRRAWIMTGNGEWGFFRSSGAHYILGKNPKAVALLRSLRAKTQEKPTRRPTQRGSAAGASAPRR